MAQITNSQKRYKNHFKKLYTCTQRKAYGEYEKTISRMKQGYCRAIARKKLYRESKRIDYENWRFGNLTFVRRMKKAIEVPWRRSDGKKHRGGEEKGRREEKGGTDRINGGWYRIFHADFESLFFQRHGSTVVNRSTTFFPSSKIPRIIGVSLRWNFPQLAKEKIHHGVQVFSGGTVFLPFLIHQFKYSWSHVNQKIQEQSETVFYIPKMEQTLNFGIDHWCVAIQNWQVFSKYNLHWEAPERRLPFRQIYFKYLIVQ